MELNEQTRRFIQILTKIPMFQRLTPVQSLEILKVCRPRSFSPREVLVEHGSKGTEMYVLLTGKLVVTAPDGTPLTYLSPITTVGEMGVITGQPRTANVIADGSVSVFEISRIKFEVLIKKYPDIGFSIYRNVIHTLSQRLDTTNKQLVTSQNELEEIRSQSGALLEASANLDT